MIPAHQITINSRKYDQRIRRSWICRLVRQDDSLLVFEGEFDQDVEHPDLGFIERGTISYEYYWLDRWYSIFRFHRPDGGFRNYYCNINMPPVFENGVLDYVDLEMDVLVWPDSTYQILDRDEYEQNAAKFGYPDALRNEVSQALAQLIAMAEEKTFPPPVDFVQQK